MAQTQLLLGDCVERMQEMPPECIDLTVTSPPYDNMRKYHGFTFDYKQTFEQLYRVTKLGGMVVWVVADQTIKGSETGSSMRQALYAMDCGFKLHDTMVWIKDGGGAIGSQKTYTQNWEYMFVFAKGTPKSINLLRDRENRQHGQVKARGGRRRPDGTIKPHTVREIPEYSRRNNWWMVPFEQINDSNGHPASFPVALARDHILSWSTPGDTVLDPFMGSGTTGVACIQTDRNFIGIEISDEYYKMSSDRIAHAAAQVTMNDILSQVSMDDVTKGGQ